MIKPWPLLVSIVVAALGNVDDAYSMPWDVDMYRQQSYKSGEMARSPVTGTVPSGFRPFTLTVEEAEKTLKNPVPFEFNSVWRGKRLFTAHCVTCHGHKGEGDGPTGAEMKPPSLLGEFYKNYGDGRIYAVLIRGGAMMPRYGYKFSDAERWDLVNYVRFLQGRNVEGMKRP